MRRASGPDYDQMLAEHTPPSKGSAGRRAAAQRSGGEQQEVRQWAEGLQGVVRLCSASGLYGRR